MEAPILSLPQEHGNYMLDTDASDHGIGVMLSQIQDGEECIICYASRLYFLVRIDHTALQWLRRTPEPIGQQSQWLEVLENSTSKSNIVLD